MDSARRQLALPSRLGVSRVFWTHLANTRRRSETPLVVVPPAAAAHSVSILRIRAMVDRTFLRSWCWPSVLICPAELARRARPGLWRASREVTVQRRVPGNSSWPTWAGAAARFACRHSCRGAGMGIREGLAEGQKRGRCRSLADDNVYYHPHGPYKRTILGANLVCRPTIGVATLGRSRVS